MKKSLLYCLVAALTLLAGCGKDDPDSDGDQVADSSGSGSSGSSSSTTVSRNGESGITYQLLVYSFADSDGDGIGDFNGIKSKLDYLDEMGVKAIWLSPIHEASSYHGYDVLDYESVNSEYGTESDFQSLLTAAHAKGMKIYLDFVLNHTSKDHPWFLDAKASTESEYRDYFIFSDDPKSDIAAGNIPMIATEGSSGYDSGQWFSAVSGSVEDQKIKFTITLSSGKPSTIKAEQVESGETPSEKASVWLYYGDGEMAQFGVESSTTLSLTEDITSSWGVLVRTSTTSWDGNTKYGALTGSNQLEWGVELALSTSDPQDILLPGMTSTQYHSHMWTSYFADLNYGSASTCESSAAFKALTAAADKWIDMGVDGFRLDAVKHIYHNADSDENPTFLKKFYDHCNSTYKAAGHSDDIYIVGEQFSDASSVAPYYAGLPAFFEFSFWWTLQDAINNGVGSGFVGTIQGYQNLYSAYRSDYIEATKLSNHDEDRAGSDLGKSTAKMKLAGAVLLTAAGEPYIYQGEELGYWGVKDNGDEYVRTPIMWNADGSDLASEKLDGKVDNSMLTSSISVETQAASESSVLSVYRKFGVLRDSYEALSKGSFDYCSAVSSTSQLAGWYRTYGSQKILVLHNFSAASVGVTLSSVDLTDLIGSNGTVTVSGSRLTLGAYGTALFMQ